MKSGHTFPTFLVFLKIMWLILAESDILSDFADGLGSDVEERGYVLQGKVLHDAGTTQQQQLIALAGRGAVEVEIARTELEENVLVVYPSIDFTAMGFPREKRLDGFSCLQR